MMLAGDRQIDIGTEQRCHKKLCICLKEDGGEETFFLKNDVETIYMKLEFCKNQLQVNYMPKND
jgi:hypothetical protein